MENLFDRFSRMTEELLDTIDAGKLDENSIGEFSCEYLIALLALTNKMGSDNRMYIAIRSYIENININSLKKKAEITVGFMVHDTTVWIGDDLYRMLDSSGRFKPYICCLKRDMNAESEVVDKEYEGCVSFYLSKGFQVVRADEPNAIKAPDICIWLTPWVEDFTDAFRLEHFPLSTMHTYIPYGFFIAENEQNNYVDFEFNLDIHNILWKTFAETRMSLDMARRYSFANTGGVYTGYPKMDGFYTVKRSRPNDGKKLVIYAPHHSFTDNEHVRFSTFNVNYRKMLEIARRYGDSITWVFKPHPILKYKCLLGGLFGNEAEWNAYLDEWRDIGDSYVVESGTYTELFVNSDAMIFDSVSFMAEYLYVDKPALFLTRQEQKFNEFGELVKDVHYTADGTDYDAIEAFITDVVIGGEDNRHDIRHSFFEENLDYVGENDNLAAKNIYNELEKAFV